MIVSSCMCPTIKQCDSVCMEKDNRLEAAQAALENELKKTTLAEIVADTKKIMEEE